MPSGRILTRCLRCNDTLEAIDRSAVRAKVPPYVFETQPNFRTCNRCGRVYWRGTHHDKSQAEIREIFGLQDDLPH